jgi:hypothetical protein
MRGVIGAPAVLMAFVASFPSCTRPLQEKPSAPAAPTVPPVQMPAAQMPSRQVSPVLLSGAQLPPAPLPPEQVVALGRPAPDIEGRDLDGNPMRLSDHRGKIVVLLFSGHW